MESEHSRGESLACCHKRAIEGLLQKLWINWGVDRLLVAGSTAMAKNVAVEESLQDEWQRFNRLVATAAGSRGSRLSVFEIARSSFFIAGAEEVLLSRQTAKKLKSLLNKVAKLSMIVGNVDGC
jgi:hypothetical protein